MPEDLVEVPIPLDEPLPLREASLTDLGGKHWAKSVPPEPHGLVADVDAALREEIFDVAKGQWIPDVHHHREADDLR
jgi:hypothetical protein